MRINVMGSSGSGKSTLAATIARVADIPRLELDAIHHLPGWKPRPLDEFRQEIAAFVTQDAWVIDGDYTKSRDIVWGRADTVLFLDLPRPQVMYQLLRRTLVQVVRQTELWNGNREDWRTLLSTAPEDNILVWSWTRHPVNRRRFDDACHDPRWVHIEFVRLCSHAQARRWLTHTFET